MIDARQIRAARALLSWSQADLARAARMATSSIKNIENGNTAARHETLVHVRDAFETNGVEFQPSSGVRLKSDIVSVHDGRRATTALLDSIYATAHASAEREVLILGLDERYSVETDGHQLLADHISRLKAAGIGERILIREGDTNFLNDPTCYRWLPALYFTRSAPIYIYGDTVAVHTGSLKRRTTIIRDRAHALNMRQLFEALWAKASTPPELPAVAGGMRR